MVLNSAGKTCCKINQYLFLHERKPKHDQKRPIYVCSIHLIPLQLKEVVEIVGVEGRAYVRRCGSLAESEIRVGRVWFGSEGVKSAGLVGVLQGEIDPVKKLGRLVHGGTRVYGRQQAHLSIQMA